MWGVAMECIFNENNNYTIEITKLDSQLNKKFKYSLVFFYIG